MSDRVIIHFGDEKLLLRSGRTGLQRAARCLSYKALILLTDHLCGKKDCYYAAVVLLSLALISFFQILPSKERGGEKGKSEFHWGTEEVGVEGRRAERLKNERLVEEYSKVSE